eukprot:scaffold846_cov336-Pavlova_lutheri.AAC.17
MPCPMVLFPRGLIRMEHAKVRERDQNFDEVTISTPEFSCHRANTSKLVVEGQRTRRRSRIEDQLYRAVAKDILYSGSQPRHNSAWNAEFKLRDIDISTPGQGQWCVHPRVGVHLRSSSLRSFSGGAFPPPFLLVHFRFKSVELHWWSESFECHQRQRGNKWTEEERRWKGHHAVRGAGTPAASNRLHGARQHAIAHHVLLHPYLETNVPRKEVCGRSRVHRRVRRLCTLPHLLRHGRRPARSKALRHGMRHHTRLGHTVRTIRASQDLQLPFGCGKTVGGSHQRLCLSAPHHLPCHGRHAHLAIGGTSTAHFNPAHHLLPNRFAGHQTLSFPQQKVLVHGRWILCPGIPLLRATQQVSRTVLALALTLARVHEHWVFLPLLQGSTGTRRTTEDKGRWTNRRRTRKGQRQAREGVVR